MTAVFSSTNNPTYLFFLPIVAWGWHKLGIDCIIFVPREITPVDELIQPLLEKYADVIPFDAPEEKQATYSQVIRLYAAAMDFKEDEILITTDADMLFLKKDYFVDDPRMTIYGADLTPVGQYPMCYAVASAKEWKRLFNITMSEQMCADRELYHINVDNMRGNYWCRDQEVLYNAVKDEAFLINRSDGTNQFALHRLDRDDSFLLDRMDDKVIDFHMPRPGYIDSNFETIMAVLRHYYPNEDFTWLVDYRNEFVKYLEV